MLLRPGVVHRLDKETSGCLVVAKYDLAHLRLSSQFAGRKVQKFYLALCAGGFTKLLSKLSSRSAGIWCIVKRWPSSTVADPLTSVRSHPANKPGDDSLPDLYGTSRPDSGPPPFDWLIPSSVTRCTGKPSGDYGREMLPAWRLGFFHPIAENWMEFEAGLPDDFLESGVEENSIV